MTHFYAGEFLEEKKGEISVRRVTDNLLSILKVGGGKEDKCRYGMNWLQKRQEFNPTNLNRFS